MGRPPGQSDFDYAAPEVDREGDQTRNGANPRVAKVVYVIVAIAFAVLFFLVMVQLHVPRGE
jgi:hypothetical protein